MQRVVLYSETRPRDDGKSVKGMKQMKQKRLKQLGAALLAGSLVVSSGVSASACCGLYVGSQQSENGSTYVGRSEDIGKLYDKVFEVRPAADHAEGEMYEDTYGFSMPYPSHTYRYTVLRDSIEQGESVVDEDGNLVREAYGEVGMNEKGVSVSATVSTSYNANAKAADPLVDTGICEISLTSVILMSADSARDGVEKLYTIKLIVQPILENAIYHGMAYADGDGEITILARRDGDDVIIDVTDNGPGMPEEVVERLLDPREQKAAPSKGGSGIGFRNVHQRIRLTFGEPYGLTIRSEPDAGTTVRIRLPALTEPPGEKKEGTPWDAK